MITVTLVIAELSAENAHRHANGRPPIVTTVVGAGDTAEAAFAVAGVAAIRRFGVTAGVDGAPDEPNWWVVSYRSVHSGDGSGAKGL